jgi:lambda family phage portal protein
MNALDAIIGMVSPTWAASRAVARIELSRARATLSDIEKWTGTGSGGYEAGRLTRLTQGRRGSSANENGIPRAQITQLRNMSWECYRNNAHARKIVRTLEGRIIGRGPKPQSQATLADGEAYVEFRTRAEALWRAAAWHIDYRGRPGEGGLHLADLARVALRAVILSGEVLVRYRSPRQARLPRDERRLTMPPPLKAQLIRGDRLDETQQENRQTGNQIIHGIEVSDEGRRVAYWLRETDDITADPVRVPAKQIAHLFVPEDVDQLRGVPWFAPALFKLRDIGDYEHHELTAAAMGSCVVAGVRRNPGQSGMGVVDSDWDVTDGDGNPITNLRPGMFLNLGQNGEIQSFNPQRPNSQAVEFLGHELRALASAMPGMKGSQLTGDYRASSFASERAAENEAWPEVEIAQDWFATFFSQVMYERLVEEGVKSGWFDATDGFSTGDFNLRREQYIPAEWQGPVARSINPVDDAEAAAARVRAGLTSLQMEQAMINSDGQEVVNQQAATIDMCEEAGLSEDYIGQIQGIVQQDTAKDEGDEEDGQTSNGASPAAA